MKRYFKWLLVVVCVLMLPVFAVADDILFPWVPIFDSVSTVVSITNSSTSDTLNLVYRYKAGDNYDNQTATCEHYDISTDTSENDILTFDASGNINGGQPIFGDVVSGTKGYTNADLLALGNNITKPARAFLLVSNETTTVPADRTLYGEAMVLEIAGGAAWGYVAYNPEGAVTTPNAFNDFFGDRLGEVIANNEYVQVALWPPNKVTTKFFITPVTSASMDNGKLSVKVRLCKTESGGDCVDGGVWFNDETGVSTTKEKSVVCTAAPTLDHLLESAAYNAFKNKNTMGWTNVVVNPGSTTGGLAQTEAAIIGKLDYTTSGITIEDTTVPGTLNNFIWLRIR